MKPEGSPAISRLSMFDDRSDGHSMYLLYLDESGNPDEPADRHFVLGGAAIFERQTFFRSSDLHAIQTRHFPQTQPLEFHTQSILSGKGFWREIQRSVREAILEEIAQVIADPHIVLFAAAVEKDAELHGEEAVKHATEQICSRFDMFLKRLYHTDENPQRGLIVFDEGRFEHRHRIWVRGFRDMGTQWGDVLANLADIPFFASSKETRLLQVADYVAHSVFRLYERRDPKLIQPILDRFDQEHGKLHGLVHVSKARTGCECPACASRRAPHHFGSWI
ncbi:MAG: DUF3800 domain-containing protein [Actinomycetota bacterium]